MCCDCCTVRQQKIWLFSVSSILVVIGLVLIFAWPSITAAIIDARMTLVPDNKLFKVWVRSPMPVYLSFYLFNWTNPHEASNAMVKPNFEQIGPYTFSDYKVKEDLKWNEENETVTFFARRTFHFMPEMSKGSLDAIITTPHFPTMAAAKITRRFGKTARQIVNFALNREGGKLYVSQTAIEWIFNGFYDHLLDFAERLHSPVLPIYSNNFAWFYKRNNSKTAEGTFTVHTGRGDTHKLGDLKMWNGSDHTGFWQGECGRVNGSTGELWSPGKSFDENISIFISDTARFINLFPSEQLTYRDVKAWRYTSTNQTFDSGHIAADTACFCVPNRPCPPNGATDYSPVVYGAPILMSHPHFFRADPHFLANTTGLHPNASEHDNELIMEPTLAVPLKVNGQVMISGLVEQDEHIDLLKDLAWNFYAPLITFRMHTDITDEFLRSVKLILDMRMIGQYVGGVLVVLGSVILLTGIWVTHAGKWCGNMDSPDSEETKSSEISPDKFTTMSNDKSAAEN